VCRYIETLIIRGQILSGFSRRKPQSGTKRNRQEQALEVDGTVEHKEGGKYRWFANQQKRDRFDKRNPR
jgi:hypothetical protein